MLAAHEWLTHYQYPLDLGTGNPVLGARISALEGAIKTGAGEILFWLPEPESWKRVKVLFKDECSFCHSVLHRDDQAYHRKGYLRCESGIALAENFASASVAASISPNHLRPQGFLMNGSGLIPG